MTRRKTGLAASLMAAVLLTLLLAACGTGPGGAKTLASESVRAFQQAPVKTIQGSFRDGMIPVSFKVTVGAHGDASGTGTFDHFPVGFLRAGGKTYVNGVTYWQWERLPAWPVWPQLGQLWVRTSHDPATSAFEAALTAGDSVTTLRQRAAAMSVGAPVRGDGQQVYPLTYGSATFDVIAGDGHRLVGVRDPGMRVGAMLLSGIRLSIAYGGTLQAVPPAAGQYVDPGDPSTLPAMYTDLGLVGQAPCDQTGCTATLKVGNDGGAPLGQSVVTFRYYETGDDQDLLSTCQASIPAIPYNGSAQVSCHATGAALVAWMSSNDVWYDALITNPPYTSP